MQNCDVFCNGMSGLVVAKGGHPEVASCRTHANWEAGMYVMEEGGGTIEQSCAYQNVIQGAWIAAGADPLMRECVFSHNPANGMVCAGTPDSIYNQSQPAGRMIDCTFSENGQDGALVFRSANPHFENCQFRDNAANGIQSIEYGHGELVKCMAAGNKANGVRVGMHAFLQLSDCSLENNNGLGLSIYTGKGVMHGCTLNRNGGGLGLGDGAHLSCVEVDIRHNRGYGVHIDTSELEMDNCTIHENEQGMVLRQYSIQVTARKCVITKNTDFGVDINDSCEAEFIECDLRGNGRVDTGGFDIRYRRMTNVTSRKSRMGKVVTYF